MWAPLKEESVSSNVVGVASVSSSERGVQRSGRERGVVSESVLHSEVGVASLSVPLKNLQFLASCPLKLATSSYDNNYK